jgi:two-component system response regulator YesN
MIIVDDNRLEREGIARLMNWTDLGVEVAGTFMNGRQALDRIEELKPDLVLSDIRMPVMNGLEFAREVSERYPQTRIVFMSSYDEFEYARTALRLQADDYLLKPIKTEQLRRTVTETLGKIEEARRAEREKEGMLRQIRQALALYREQFWRDLLFGHHRSARDIQDRLRMLDMDADRSTTCLVAIFRFPWDEGEGKALTVSDRYYAAYMLQKKAKQMVNSGVDAHAAQLSDKDTALIFCSKDRKSDEKALIDAVVALKEQIESALSHPCIVGVSHRAEGLEMLPNLYRQAKLAAETKYYGEAPGGRLVLYGEIEATAESDFGTVVDLQELFRDVKLALQDRLRRGEFVARYLDNSRRYSDKYVRTLMLAVQQSIELIYAEAGKKFRETAARIGREPADSWQSIGDVLDDLNRLLEAAGTHLMEENKSQYDRLVEEIRAIIADKYKEPLTVQTIADQMYMSPSHLNNIFKQKTGRTIFDCLTEYRMEKAKELLRQPHSRIYLVAQEVGYVNKSHFCLVFRKHTGVSPTEFKNGVVSPS